MAMQARLDALCSEANKALRSPKDALQHAAEGLRLIGDVMGFRHHADLLYIAGRSCGGLGRYPEAIQHLARAAQTAKADGEYETHRKASLALGTVLRQLGDYEGALEEWSSVVDLAAARGDALGLRNVWNNIASVYGELGQYEDALRIYREGLADASSSAELRAVTLNNIGYLLLLAGQPRHAIEPLTEAEAIVTELGLADRRCMILGNLAMALVRTGDGRGAIEILDRSLAHARTLGFKRDEPQTLIHLGIAHRAVADVEGSAAWLREARSLAQSLGARIEAHQACEELLSTLKQAGQVVLALACSDELRAIERELHQDRSARRTSALLARLEVRKARQETEAQISHNAALKKTNAKLRIANASLNTAIQALGIDAVPKRQGTAEHAALTSREQQVLVLLGKGMPNLAIAACLDISGLTARHHVSSILRKLGVNTRTQAVAVALREGRI